MRACVPVLPGRQVSLELGVTVNISVRVRVHARGLSFALLSRVAWMF